MVFRVLKFWLRLAAKSPLPTTATMAILAVSIAAVTAVFTIVNGVLLKPLPFPEAEQLVSVPQYDGPSDRPNYTSMADYAEYENQITELSSIAAYGIVSFDLSGEGLPEQVHGCLVTRRFFSSLKVLPARGRTFGDGDSDGAIVLSDSLWRRRFAGDSSVLNKPVTLNSSPALIVGVMPPVFWFPENKCDVWRLMTPEYDFIRNHPNYHFLRVFGRLKTGATLEQVRAHLQVIGKALALAHAELNANLRISAMPLSQFLVRDLKAFLLTLMAAVTFLLLIAWANVANLQLIRSVDRRKELSIRLALGADRARLAWQLLVESLLVTVPSWLLGIGLAAAAVPLVLNFSPVAAARRSDLTLDARVLGFSLLIATASALLFSFILLLPALSPVWVVGALNESGRGSTVNRKARFVQTGLVAIEIALSLALLVNADLVLRSLINLSAVNLGIRTNNVLRAVLHLQKPKYDTEGSLDAFQLTAYQQLAQIPGVEAVVGTSDEPLTSWFEDLFDIKGYPEPPPDQRESVAQASVSPAYFHVMAISMLAGREFTDLDRSQTERVAVINETMSKRYWPNGGAVGSQVRYGTGDPVEWYKVVGVVRDSRPLLDWDPVPKIFTPFLQPPTDASDHFQRPVTLMLVTRGKPANFVADLRNALYRLDPTLAVEIQPMDDLVSNSLAPPKFRALLLGALSIFTLWLSVFGIYGVIASFVGTQTKEIGIRMVLGSTPRGVVMLFVRKGMWTTAAGLVLGAILAFLVTPELKSVLYGVRATDPSAYLAAIVLLSLTSFSAVYFAAAKAVRVNPVVALSYE